MTTPSGKSPPFLLVFGFGFLGFVADLVFFLLLIWPLEVGGWLVVGWWCPGGPMSWRIWLWIWHVLDAKR